jgi:hypothetical protein
MATDTYYYDTGTTWGEWTTLASNTTSTISDGATWIGWTTAGTTITTSSNVIWRTWTNRISTAEISTGTISCDRIWTNWEIKVQETREQKRAREAQEVINAAKHQDIQDARAEAELTAQKLLEDLITPDEMAIYKKTGHILVKGARFDYLLQKNYQASVIKLEKGKLFELSGFKGKLKGRSLCVHPENQHYIPDTDKIITLKLAIEAEEERVLKTANDHGERQFDLVVNQ